MFIKLKHFKTKELHPTNLEHSLYSVSLWESKYEKPFLTESEKSEDELYYYISCMNRLEPNPVIDERALTKEDFEVIREYIESKATATFFRDTKDKKKTTHNKLITSELLYAWLSIMRIPIQAEHWHLNRLITTIKAVDAEQNPPKEKENKRQMAMDYRAINEKRLAEIEARKAKRLAESKGK